MAEASEGPGPYYDIGRGAWRVVAEPARPGEARIRFSYQGQPFREISYPAYKVWDIAARLRDITADYERGMTR